MPLLERRPLRATGISAGIALAALLSACAPWGLGQEDAQPAGISCIDDSPHCVDRRRAALKALTDDKQHSWVRQAPTPQAYASGVRLFAFKQKKRDLTCDELTLGRREADAAAKTLRSAGGLTPAQVARGAMLGTEVSRELQREIARRC
ncbi:MAG: hypothetical protein ACREC6_06870 [Hyphomicrobiaceae bacterium]